MALGFTSVALAIEVQVPEASLQQHLAATPSVITAELVRQIMSYERHYTLGYYPALEYLVQNNALDMDLVNALENITWVVSSLVRNEIKQKLRSVFASLRFDAIQPMANALPNIKVHDPDKQNKLLRHYDMTCIKVNLTATMIQKSVDKDMAQNLASHLATRWLSDSFDRVEIKSSKAIA